MPKGMPSLGHRRRTLLPAILLGSVCGLLARHAFVPAPGASRVPEVRQSAPEAAATAATALALAAMVDPAHAGGVVAADSVSPMAHGAIGGFEAGDLQGIFEKCVFGGLLLSTALAWWRSTLGNARAGDQEFFGRPYAWWTMAFANVFLALLESNRWYESGHFPLSNMYESLMFLAWGLTAATIWFAADNTTGKASDEESKTSDIAYVWASPATLGIVAFATLTLPKELQKASALVPALQSNWLVMHVSVIMMSYATLMFGSLLCMAVVALSQPKDSPINALRNSTTPFLSGIANTLSPPQPVPAGAAAATMATGVEAEEPSGDQESGLSNRMEMTSSAGGSVTMEFTQASGGAASVVLSEDDQLAIRIDDLAYRSVLLGFGFLTIGIISGGVWANEAWGSYWSWDPKETWALICWLIYAGYLHTRLQLGWDSRDSAMVGAFGFLVIWFCYVGVNLLGVGLHSYGFFLK